jgi:hypothetical protein
MPRISKENYYLDIAETVLERATCLRRIYGAIIVKNDEIISTGYNGIRKHIFVRLCRLTRLNIPKPKQKGYLQWKIQKKSWLREREKLAK